MLPRFFLPLLDQVLALFFYKTVYHVSESWRFPLFDFKPSPLAPSVEGNGLVSLARVQSDHAKGINGNWGTFRAYDSSRAGSRERTTTVAFIASSQRRPALTQGLTRTTQAQALTMTSEPVGEFNYVASGVPLDWRNYQTAHDVRVFVCENTEGGD